MVKIVHGSARSERKITKGRPPKIVPAVTVQPFGKTYDGDDPKREHVRPEKQRTSGERNGSSNEVINRMNVFRRESDGNVEVMVDFVKTSIEKGMMQSAMTPVEQSLVNEKARGDVRDDLEH